MKRTDIERIIKQGSVKQKIKLYMTDIALLNVDMRNLLFDINVSNKENPIHIKGSTLLTERERDLLWNSIKDPKDVKYYNELVTWNRAFLLFKDKFSIDLMRLRALYYLICISNQEEIKRAESKDLVNDILDLIPDKKLRDKVFNKAIQLTKGDGGREYQEKGYPKYLDIDRSLWWTEIRIPTETAIETTKSCKTYLKMFKAIVKDNLPLTPYRDWIKEQEKQLQKLTTAIYETTVLEDCPPDFPIIERYEDIEANITEEDIEDFKNAGR